MVRRTDMLCASDAILRFEPARRGVAKIVTARACHPLGPLCIVTSRGGWERSLRHMPPDTASISPVTQRASSDARNTATGAISSGCPTRPNGVCCNICFSKSLPTIPADRVPSVCISPGLMAFTLIFRGPSSFASTRVIASMAPFEATYTEAPGGGLRVTAVLRLIMLPPSGPRCLMASCVISTTLKHIYVEMLVEIILCDVLYRCKSVDTRVVHQNIDPSKRVPRIDIQTFDIA